MTVIVGIVHKDNVYMGSDRGAASSDVIMTTLQPKVSLNHGFLVGYSGSGFGVGQLATLAEYPADGENLNITLRTIFCKSLKTLIEEYGGTENGSHELLIGGYGRLFEINTDDWGIIEVSETAVGSGHPYSLGSLYTSLSIEGTTPMDRVYEAVYAAIRYSPHCQGPVDTFMV